MRHNQTTIIIIILFLIILMTFPLVFNLNSCIPGFFSTDEPYAALWNFWLRKSSLENQLSLKHTYFISYPWGRDMSASGFLPPILLVSFINILAFLTTPVLTFNTQVLVNLFLMAYLAYLLIFHLTKSKISSIFGVIAFTFCPYQFARIWQHLSLTYNEWLVLALLSAVLLKEKNILRYKIIFVLSLVLLFSFDYSIMYLGIFILSVFLLYSLIYRLKEKLLGNASLLIKDLRYCFTLLALGVISLIILLPQILPTLRYVLSPEKGVASAFNSYIRPFEDLFAQSARPLSYFLPSVDQPVFGKFTEKFVGSNLYGASFTEHALYLGWLPLILAFFAFRKWRARRKSKELGTAPCGDSPSNREDFYIGFFAFLAVMAWLFSQPPWWNLFGFKVYMPPFFMYKVLPMYRAYCRFGIVVMLAVAVLGAYGLKFILEKFQSRGKAVSVGILFCALLLFEFWNYPPFKVIDVSRMPQAYAWLRAQPQGCAIAEYPLDAESPNERYKFYQTIHQKKMINGTVPGTQAHEFAKTITKLSDLRTAEVLKGMGVTYVLVHHDGYLQTDLISDMVELDNIPKNKGLKLIKVFPAQDCSRQGMMCIENIGLVSVYELVAKPIKPNIE